MYRETYKCNICMKFNTLTKVVENIVKKKNFFYPHLLQQRKYLKFSVKNSFPWRAMLYTDYVSFNEQIDVFNEMMMLEI